MKIVISSFNECCPLEKVKISYKNRHDWVAKELKADMKKRKELYTLSKKTQLNIIFKEIKNLETLFYRDKGKLKENITKSSTIKVSMNKITKTVWDIK